MVVTGKQIKDMMGVSERCQDWMQRWETDETRYRSRDTQVLPLFLETIGPYVEGDRVVSWGCGAGRAEIGIWNEGYDVTLVDFAPNCLDEHVRGKLGKSLRFVDHDLTKPKVIRSEYGFCVDLLQHIDAKDVDETLKTIFESCRNCFFVIGADGVNNKGYDYWLRKFSQHSVIVHRSMMGATDRAVAGNGFIVFYTSGYSGLILDKNFVPNTTPEELERNLRENAKVGAQTLQMYPKQDRDIILLCGGPSLNDYEDEIREKREAGAFLLTVNGTYNWCLERDIKPSLQFVLDAKLHNKKFLEPVIDDCVYLVGSCVHPTLFDGLPLERTFLWHVNVDDAFFHVYEELFGEAYDGWVPIAGGSTVALRALYTLKVLGLHHNRIDIYGMDSCLLDDNPEQHHAYPQPENDPSEETGLACNTVRLTLHEDKENQRSFLVQPWHIAQAKEFILLKQTLLAELDLQVHGPGLIAYLLESGAHLEE